MKLITNYQRVAFPKGVAVGIAVFSLVAKNGGLITLADLKAYKAIWRTPVCGDFLKLKSAQCHHLHREGYIYCRF